MHAYIQLRITTTCPNNGIISCKKAISVVHSLVLRHHQKLQEAKKKKGKYTKNKDKQCAIQSFNDNDDIEKTLDLDFTYVFVDDAYSLSFLIPLFFLIFFSPLLLTAENSATDCSLVYLSHMQGTDIRPYKCDSSFKQAIEFASTTFQRRSLMRNLLLDGETIVYGDSFLPTRD